MNKVCDGMFSDEVMKLTWTRNKTLWMKPVKKFKKFKNYLQ